MKANWQAVQWIDGPDKTGSNDLSDEDLDVKPGEDESAEKRGATQHDVRELELEQPQSPDKGTQEAPPDPEGEARQASPGPGDGTQEALLGPISRHGRRHWIPGRKPGKFHRITKKRHERRHRILTRRHERRYRIPRKRHRRRHRFRGGDKGCRRACSRVDRLGRAGRTRASEAQHQRQSFTK